MVREEYGHMATTEKAAQYIEEYGSIRCFGKTAKDDAVKLRTTLSDINLFYSAISKVTGALTVDTATDKLILKSSEGISSLCLQTLFNSSLPGFGIFAIASANNAGPSSATDISRINPPYDLAVMGIDQSARFTHGYYDENGSMFTKNDWTIWWVIYKGTTNEGECDCAVAFAVENRTYDYDETDNPLITVTDTPPALPASVNGDADRFKDIMAANAPIAFYICQTIDSYSVTSKGGAAVVIPWSMGENRTRYGDGSTSTPYGCDVNAGQYIETTDYVYGESLTKAKYDTLGTFPHMLTSDQWFYLSFANGDVGKCALSNTASFDMLVPMYSQFSYCITANLRVTAWGTLQSVSNSNIEESGTVEGDEQTMKHSGPILVKKASTEGNETYYLWCNNSLYFKVDEPSGEPSVEDDDDKE